MGHDSGARNETRLSNEFQEVLLRQKCRAQQFSQSGRLSARLLHNSAKFGRARRLKVFAVDYVQAHKHAYAESKSICSKYCPEPGDPPKLQKQDNYLSP